MKKVLFFFLLLILAAFGAQKWIMFELKSPLDIKDEVIVEVLYGDNIYKVADKFRKEKIIKIPQILVWYARFTGQAELIKAGEYKIVTGKSIIDVLNDMVNGNAIKYSITLIEGWTTRQAIQEIQKSKGIVSTLDASDDQLILKSIDEEHNYTSSEGLFFPDTYQYTKGTKDRDILKRAHQSLLHELDQIWKSRAENLPYKTPYEVLIMASIIEKESGVDVERPQIAGVFVERLKIGMRLQTDPTVIYGMGDKYDGNIRRSDLVRETEYNTYTIDGLPPTPISLASRSSIKAAVNPLLNGMLFFVAKGNGRHYFSKTYSEHEKNVQLYQLSRDDNYRSTVEKCESSDCNEEK